MKYIVSAAATLALKNGARFSLEPGIHDSESFPEDVKNHWAFGTYVKPVDAADIAKEEAAQNAVARLADVEKELTALKEQAVTREETIAAHASEIASLKDEIAQRDEEITALKELAAGTASNAKKQPATK